MSDITTRQITENTYQITGTSSSYPRKDDCYVVTITNKQKQVYVSQYMPKTEYHLIQTLKSLKLKDSELEKLVKAINDAAEYQREVTSDDAAMEAAENDI